MKDDKQRIAELFDRALDFEPAERAAFLAGACGNDVNLRRRVEALLAAHGEKAGFLPVEGATTEAGASTVLGGVRLTEGAGTLIGRYKLLEKLGEGGFGAVWAAEQREPVKRRVALKIIKLGMDTRQVVARFEAERQALALMDHPNIAKVLDAGTTDNGRPYFVMELVKGIPITKYCEQEKLGTQERLDLFIKVCHAIQHAHQKGIIHRDIKPSNILVTLHDGVPVPKVIDFGIAKATQQELTELTIYTQHHQFIGTPAYMSPEQAEMSGLDIDTRSDIYSLGVLLYELLTGATPFDAKELMQSGIDEMRRIIREQEPVRPSTRLSQTLSAGAARGSAQAPVASHRSQIDHDLDWIVMKCLEKDRSRRYDTANSLAADIARHLVNEPIVARPPSTAYKLQKTWRRHKLVVTAGVAVVVALLAGLCVSVWQYRGKSRAEREQVGLRERAEAKALEASEARRLASEQRDLARARLHESLVREARSLSRSRQVGYRREVFDRLQQALTLGVTNVSSAQMRTEFVSSLGDWVGLDSVDIPIPGGAGIGVLTRDGSLAALAHLAGPVVSLRETRTGRELASLSVAGTVWSLVFDRRGTALFVFTAERGLTSFDRQRPKQLQLERWQLQPDGAWKREWVRPTTGLTQLAHTDDGPVALSVAADDSHLTVTDLDRDVELARITTPRRLPTYPVMDIRGDRSQLVFTSLDEANDFDYQLEVWDLAGGQPAGLIRPRLGRTSVAYSPDGRHLAASFDAVLIVYETARFGPTLNIRGTFESGLGVTIGGPDLVAVPEMQAFTVRLIQLGSGREVARLQVSDPIGQAFSRDGSVLLLTHQSGARLVPLRADHERVRLEAHQGGVPAVEFSPDGRLLASTGKDRTLRLWDLNSGSARILGQLPAPGQTLAFTPDGQHLICGHYNIGDLSVWSVATGRKVGNVPEALALRGTTWAAAISPDGNYFAAIGAGLRVWSLPELLATAATPGTPLKPLIAESNGVSGVVFDPTSRRLAFLDMLANQPSFSTCIRARELVQTSPSRIISTNSQINFVQGLTFLPRSGKLAYVTGDRTIAIVEPDSGHVIKSLADSVAPGAPRAYVGNLRSSPDESRLALVNVSGLAVELWDPATGELLYSLPEEPGAIWWLAWSPDGQRLAVARASGDISVWNLKEVEAQLAQFGLPPLPVSREPSVGPFK